MSSRIPRAVVTGPKRLVVPDLENPGLQCQVIRLNDHRFPCFHLKCGFENILFTVGFNPSWFLARCRQTVMFEIEV